MNTHNNNVDNHHLIPTKPYNTIDPNDIKTVFNLYHNYPTLSDNPTIEEQEAYGIAASYETIRANIYLKEIATIDDLIITTLLVNKSLMLIPTTFQPATGRIIAWNNKDTAVAMWLHQGALWVTNPAIMCSTIDEALAAAQKAENNAMPQILAEP